MQRERFVVFFPLQTALNRSIFSVVAHEELPESAKQFPVFRAAGHIDREGRVHDWWLWDGEREWKVGQLTTEQRQLPLLELWNDTLLIERIEKEWTPEHEWR
jgi:hypothetical protein